MNTSVYWLVFVKSRHMGEEKPQMRKSLHLDFRQLDDCYRNAQLTGGNVTPGQIVLDGTRKQVEQPEGSSQEAAFLHGLHFISCLLVPALTFLCYLWLVGSTDTEEELCM